MFLKSVLYKIVINIAHDSGHIAELVQRFTWIDFILQRLNQVLVSLDYVAFVCSDIVSKFLRISLLLDFTQFVLLDKFAIES